jgi:hypothetical protein
MSRQSGFIFRTTISISLDLKKRMDAVGESVNWSAVAARAFEDKLAEIANRRKKTAEEEVLERLRSSIRRYKNEDYKRGDEAGRSWAKQHAEVQELENLASFHPKTQMHFWSWGPEDRDDADSAARQVLAAMRPEGRSDRQASKAFWQEVLGKEHPQGALLEGFVEGVLAFWNEVKDKL